MKKFRFYALLSIFVVFVLSSCNNYFNETAYYADVNTPVSSESTKTITITATSEENIVNFAAPSASARTLLPAAIGASDLKFYIGAKKAGDSVYGTFAEVTFTATGGSTTTGTITATYDLASYEFKLYALPSATTVAENQLSDSTLKGLAILAAYAAADLRYNDSVNFYLSSNSLTNNGTFDIGITSSWQIPTGYSVKVGVYGVDTNTLVYPSDATGEREISTGGAKINAIGASSFKNETGMAPGNYNLVIKIIASPTRTYTYSESLIILPGRKTGGTIDLPNIIDYPPTQPASFIAGYAKPLTSDQDYYTVDFAWTDTSYCERGFQLEILLADKDQNTFFTTPKTDKEWDDLMNTTLSLDATKKAASKTDWRNGFDTNLLVLNKKNFQTYVNTITDGTGSLYMNGKHLSMKFPLEHRFVARICAENDVGQSAYTYLDLHQNTTTACTAGTELKNGLGYTTLTPQTTSSAVSLASGCAKFDDDVTSINLYRIKYYLSGGTFADAAETLTAAEMPNIITYHSQHNAMDMDSGSPKAEASTSKTAILTPNSKAATTSPVASAVNVTKNTYLDTTGTEQTEKYLQLKNGDLYWLKWTIDSAGGSDYPTTETTIDTKKYNTPNVYTGYENLQLFAIYNETTDVVAGVEIENATSFELGKKDILIRLNKSGGADVTGTHIKNPEDPATYKLSDIKNDGVLDISSSGENAVREILLTKNTTTCYAYDNMHLIVTRNVDNVVQVDQDIDPTSSGWKIDVSKYKTGKYVFAITASTRNMPNVTYRINSIINITQ
ncbi:MAG: hypothetical protein MR424_03165 [Treponema sp.]|nr:hypothetical protein [Treponema sp.]